MEQLLLACQELPEELSTDFMKQFLVACQELPKDVSTDFIEQFVVARQEMPKEFSTALMAKLARWQLMVSTKTGAARNLGAWEDLVKAPKVLFTFTTESAGF